jgi:hypothetical protein
MNGNGDASGSKAARWLRDWLPLIGMLVAGLVWGMKLEGSVSNNSKDIQMLTKEVYELRGLLVATGRTEERVEGLAQRLRAVEISCAKYRLAEGGQ